MAKYEHFQWSWSIIIAMIFLVLVLSLKFDDPLNPSLPFFVTMAFQLFLILIPVMFYGLRTTINDQDITLRYGIGIITIRIALSDIKKTKVVRNPWYYGIGIKVIPKGMLYNAHGFDAVELRFHRGKKRVRIGTAEPLILKYEIDKRIASTRMN